MTTLPKLLAIAALGFSVACGAQESRPNPFTGKSAAIENLLENLERVKIESAIANEQLSMTKAISETRRVGSPSMQPAVTLTEPTQSAPAPAVRKPPTPAKMQPLAVVQPVPGISLPTAPLPPQHRLIGTTESREGWIAMLYVPARNRVINLAEGTPKEGFTATNIGPQTATVNGIKLSLGPVMAKTALAETRVVSTLPVNVSTNIASPIQPAYPTAIALDLPRAR